MWEGNFYLVRATVILSPCHSRTNLILIYTASLINVWYFPHHSIIVYLLLSPLPDGELLWKGARFQGLPSARHISSGSTTCLRKEAWRWREQWMWCPCRTLCAFADFIKPMQKPRPTRPAQRAGTGTPAGRWLWPVHFLPPPLPSTALLGGGPSSRAVPEGRLSTRTIRNIWEIAGIFVCIPLTATCTELFFFSSPLESTSAISNSEKDSVSKKTSEDTSQIQNTMKGALIT